MRAHERNAPASGERRGADPAAAAAAAEAHADSGSPSMSPADHAEQFRRDRAELGDRVSQATLQAVETMHTAKYALEATLRVPVPFETKASGEPIVRGGGSLNNDAPFTHDDWVSAADAAIPRGTRLQMRWEGDWQQPTMRIAVEGPLISESECCQAPIVVRPEVSDNDVYGWPQSTHQCSKCAQTQPTHTFAEAHSDPHNDNPTRRRMPNAVVLAERAQQVRDDMVHLRNLEAKVDACVAVDEHVMHPAPHHYACTPPLPWERLPVGCTSMLALDIDDDVPQVMGFKVVDTPDGKNVVVSPAANSPETAAEFSRRVRSGDEYAVMFNLEAEISRDPDATLDILARRRQTVNADLQRMMRRETDPVPDDHPLLKPAAARAWRKIALKDSDGNLEAACRYTVDSIRKLSEGVEHHRPGVGTSSPAEQFRAILAAQRQQRASEG